VDFPIAHLVNKVYLEQYVMMFQWSHTLKAVTDDFLRILIGCPRSTESPMSHEPNGALGALGYTLRGHK
jgi:hypothetical protein